jgi:hypothetical protein
MAAKVVTGTIAQFLVWLQLRAVVAAGPAVGQETGWMAAPVVAPEETKASEVLVQLDKAMMAGLEQARLAAAVVVSLRLAAKAPAVMALPTLF